MWPSSHQELPKTYPQVCGIDLGMDELLIFDDMLNREGVETTLDMYVSLPHIL